MPSRPPADETALFDLPLEPAQPAREAAQEERAERGAQPVLPLRPPAPAAAAPRTPVEQPAREPGPRPPAGPAAVPLRLRAIAGLVDLGVCAAVIVGLLVALLSMGVRPRLADWPAAALFLLAFSFLYHVLPLAFWGRTPGMALAGLRAVAADGEPLTFRQTVLRWCGSWLTTALAGLPWLLTPGGRSLTDRLSGSVTRLRGDHRRP